MSKILLIKPRFLGLELPWIEQPMGLMYIAATLKQAGHEPKIHDCAIDYKDLHILRRTLTDWKPDFIGISIIITELEQTKQITGMVRELLPNVPVTFGGIWPTANPEESIREFGADYVVIGEGERSFPELIDAINKELPVESIPGIALLAGDDIKINQGQYFTEEELDSLPFPAWDLLDHKLYAKMDSQPAVGRRPYMAVLTSRGCPYRCAYCHQTMGKTYRRRTVESVLAEMEQLRFKYGFKEFEIIDDCFNLDRERMYAILTGVRDRLRGARLYFPNGLRSDMLEPKDAVLFKQAGASYIGFAIETTSPRLQKMINKNLNIEKAAVAIDAFVKEGIYSVGFFMLGFPTETYQEASETVEFAVRSSLHRAMFFHAVPYPGTKLAEMAADSIKSKKDLYDPRKINYYNSILNVSAMSDAELRKVLRRAYIHFYLDPIRIFRLAIRHPRFISLFHYGFLILIRMLPKKSNRSPG